jgi:ribose transport system substrate-binding protein
MGCDGIAGAVTKPVKAEVTSMSEEARVVTARGERVGVREHGRRRLSAPIWIALVTAICGLTLSACGSSSSDATAPSGASTGASSDASGCVSQATQAVKASQAPPTLPSNLQALPAGGADKLKGKLVVAIPESESLPIDVVWVNALKGALGAVGANLRVIDGGGTPSGEAQALQQAAALKPAAVLTWSITISAAPSGFQTLKDKGIPVVTIAAGWPVSSYSGEYPYAIHNAFTGIGKLMGDFALSQTKCDLHAAVFTSSIFPAQVAVADAIKAEVKALCTKCSTTLEDIEVTALATNAGPQAVAAVQSNPDTNFIIPTYAAMAGYMVPALKQAGKNVPIVSAIGSDQNVTMVEQGQQAAEVESFPTQEEAWLTVDDALRAVNGLPPGPWQALKGFIFTSDNVAQAKQFLSTGSPGYQDTFKKLWGVS